MLKDFQSKLIYVGLQNVFWIYDKFACIYGKGRFWYSYWYRYFSTTTIAIVFNNNSNVQLQ